VSARRGCEIRERSLQPRQRSRRSR
jgi:hypothetical protein